MKKLLALLLSYTLIFTSLSPAWAGGGRELVTATRVAVRSSTAVEITSNTIKTIERLLGRAPSTYVAARLAKVPRPTFVP
ncbi:MAG: hypothetical protein MJ053_05375, partial [Elusimicrobiaceae bacterium]|nr:hypothetical protein [Elusimicrobiaceae bacterium]